MNEEFKILDGILRYLLKNGNKSFTYIKEDSQLKSEFAVDIDNNTLASAFVKLVKDKYVNINEQTIGLKMDNSPRNINYYNISFEGIIFIKNDGYEKEHQNNQKIEIESAEMKKRQFLLEEKHSSIQFQLLVLTWVIAIGTSVAAIYYLLEVLKFLGVLTSCSCNN